jgi:hypothetical protein
MEINKLFETNISRCLKLHPGGIDEWSPLEWAGAMCGEAGKAANAAKKLRQFNSKLQNINALGRGFIKTNEARKEVAREAVDTILYALLLMASVGAYNPEFIISEVFNKKSEEYGFPERV